MASNAIINGKDSGRTDRRILFIDDELGSQQLFEAALYKSGYEVETIDNAVDAWALLNRDNPPRLVLCDWVMPRMDGLELCRRVRQRENDLLYTYIVLVSARTLKVDLLTAMSAGVDDYIVKPWNNEELMAKIRIGMRVLERMDAIDARLQQWRMMNDNLPCAVGAMSSDGYLRAANQTLFRLYGGDPARMIGRSVGAAMLRNSGEYVELMNHLRAGESFDAFPVEFTMANGQTRALKLWGRPIQPAFGNMVYQIMSNPL